MQRLAVKSLKYGRYNRRISLFQSALELECPWCIVERRFKMELGKLDVF